MLVRRRLLPMCVERRARHHHKPDRHGRVLLVASKHR
jgi:hypothetical protein